MGDPQHVPLGVVAQAYAELIERGDELFRLARAGEWSVLGTAWPPFVDAFAERCKLDEEVLLPAYAEHGGEARALVKQLVEEHAALRQLIQETSDQIERRRMRPVTQELLMELLREHAALKTRKLDPWIALDVRDWSSQLRRVPTVS